jgi:hypothetical protein
MSDSELGQYNMKRDVESLANSTGSALGSEDLNEKQRPPVVKGCFIATAAMGSALHPHVQLLRDFRDEILLQSRYKTAFESLLEKYYRFSPPIAKTMKEHRSINVLLRYILVYPIVFGIKLILPFVNVLLGIETDVKKRRAMVDNNFPC